MTTHATLTAIEDDIRFYPNHEEDDVPEGPLHLRWSGYLVYALDARLSERYVSGNNCIYWERGNNRDYLAPDVYVAAERVGEPPPRVYRLWLLPRILFAAEIGSKHNTRDKIAEKRGRYAQFVRPPELLETDPRDEEAGEVLALEHLHLYRLTGQRYEALGREPSGRLRSEVLGLEIGVDEEHNLRLYTLDGEPVPTYKEAEQARLAAEEQVREEARERLLAEQRAEQEARERAAAEQRTRAVEARARTADEERKVAEQRAREAEERAAEERAQREALERELAALRARLAGEDA